jgi:hypothetical protein
VNKLLIELEEISMKPIMLTGVVLIAVGVVSLAYQGITYTSSEKIIDIGSIEASVDTEKTIPLSPIMGAVAIAGGLGLVVLGRKGLKSN